MKLLVTEGAGFIGCNFIMYMLGTYPNDHFINVEALTYAGYRTYRESALIRTTAS